MTVSLQNYERAVLMAFLPEERRKKILEILNENGSVTIEELARRFWPRISTSP